MLADFIIQIHSEPPREVRVVVHKDLRAMRSAATQYDRRSGRPNTSHKDTLGVCHRFVSENAVTGQKQPLVAIVRLAPPNMGAGLVAHEMAHAAVWLWELAQGDRKLDCGNDEPFCWILGELVRQTTIKLLELDHDLGANW